MRRVSAQASNFPVPLLMLLGGTPPDKELHKYPGAYTNLLNETASDEGISDIGAWMDQRTAAAPSPCVTTPLIRLHTEC